MGRRAADAAGPWADALSVWTDRVIEALAPDAIVLCGSYARGTYRTEGSDVDLLVVGDRLPQAFSDRYRRLLDLADGLRIPLEPMAYTAAEFDALVERGHVGAYDALEFGVVLWGTAVWRRSQDRFAGLRANGLRRGRHAWHMPFSKGREPI